VHKTFMCLQKLFSNFHNWYMVWRWCRWYRWGEL